MKPLYEGASGSASDGWSITVQKGHGGWEPVAPGRRNPVYKVEAWVYAGIGYDYEGLFLDAAGCREFAEALNQAADAIEQNS